MAAMGTLATSVGVYSSQLKNNHFTEMCCCTEAGSYLRLIDSCITQLKAQGPFKTCYESKEEEEEEECLCDKGGNERAGDERWGVGSTPVLKRDSISPLLDHPPLYSPLFVLG